MSHKKNLARSIERHQQETIARQKQAELQAEEEFKLHAEQAKRAAEKRRKDFEESPAGKLVAATKKESDRREQLVRDFLDKRAKLANAGIKPGMLITTAFDVVPIKHRFTDRLHYKIVMHPIFPETNIEYIRKTGMYLASMDPMWTLLDTLDVMKVVSGMTAYCNNPMKRGQQAKVIAVNEKSCELQVISTLPKASKGTYAELASPIPS